MPKLGRVTQACLALAPASASCLSQAVRVALLGQITSQSGRLVFGLVLVDKFTG